MKYEMSLGGKPLTLVHDDLDTSINVDNLTKIDTSNIFGEHVTIQRQ